MPRKFVTGESRHITVKQKREVASMACQGCGKPVTITTPYAGDILCAECLKGASYSLEVTDETDNG